MRVPHWLTESRQTCGERESVHERRNQRMPPKSDSL